MRYLICLLLACIMCGFPGCLPRLPAINLHEAPKAGIPAPTTGKLASDLPIAKDTKEVKDDIEEAKAQIEFWKARLKVSQEREISLVKEEREAWLQSTCRKLMGLCILGMTASGFLFAASFIWPWFERLRYAAIAGTGAAVVLFCIGWYLPTQIFWIGVGILVLTVGGIIVLLHHGHEIGKAEKKTRSWISQLQLDFSKAPSK